MTSASHHQASRPAVAFKTFGHPAISSEPNARKRFCAEDRAAQMQHSPSKPAPLPHPRDEGTDPIADLSSA